MNYNPFLYELNTRIWLTRFNKDNNKAKLADIPNEYWDNLIQKKFDFVWLMGIWSICESTIDKYCFEPGLIKSYDRSLKGWKREDIIGSPYAVDVYEINPGIGDLKSLLDLKSCLNKKGIKLILDFVPNHFGAASRIVKSNPDIFLSVDKHLFESDPHTFFQPVESEEKYFAHGRDPFFPAWQDTIQVNFFSEKAREYLTGILLELIKICDGVRCDMAMLALNNVFKNTWGNVLSRFGYEKPQTEFWKEIIDKVKNVRSDFLFIGESYWDLESELHKLGFNYTYDKSFTDKLKSGGVQEIHDHLLAENEYQKKSVRFIENHDEARAITAFGKEKSKAAATRYAVLS
jgi:glycosidase